MRIQPKLLFLVCLVVPILATTSVAQSASDPQAVALLQNSLANLTKGTSVSDVTLSGNAHWIAGSDDEAGTIMMEATAAGDSRIDLGLPSGSRSEIRNHSAMPLSDAVPPGSSLPNSMTESLQPAGAWSGQDGVLHGLRANNLLTDPTWFFPAFTLTRIAASSSYSLSYVGQETIGGQSVLHVSAVQQFAFLANDSTGLGKLLQHLSQLNIYFDPTTFLPVAFGFTTHPDNNANIDIGTTIRFSDYQSVGGVEVPLHVQKFVNGNLTLDAQLGSSNINSGLSSSDFQLQ